MKDSEVPVRTSTTVGRRDFIKVGAGAGAMMTLLNVAAASAQDQPWWAARPSKTGGGSACFDRCPRPLGAGGLYQSVG